MKTNHTQGWASLKQAEKQFCTWAKAKGIPINRIDCVATFETWDKNTGIFVFFPNDSDLQGFKSDGRLLEIENQYRLLLAEANYPFDRWPVVFYFDSHENILKNYNGSYSNRLR